MDSNETMRREALGQTRAGVRQLLREQDAQDRADNVLYAACTIGDFDATGREVGGWVAYGHTPDEAKSRNPDWDFTAKVRPEDGSLYLVAQTEAVRQ